MRSINSRLIKLEKRLLPKPDRQVKVEWRGCVFDDPRWPSLRDKGMTQRQFVELVKSEGAMVLNFGNDHYDDE
jgi:hypothetical protein